MTPELYLHALDTGLPSKWTPPTGEVALYHRLFSFIGEDDEWLSRPWLLLLLWSLLSLLSTLLLFSYIQLQSNEYDGEGKEVADNEIKPVQENERGQQSFYLKSVCPLLQPFS